MREHVRAWLEENKTPIGLIVARYPQFKPNQIEEAAEQIWREWTSDTWIPGTGFTTREDMFVVVHHILDRARRIKGKKYEDHEVIIDRLQGENVHLNEAYAELKQGSDGEIDHLNRKFRYAVFINALTMIGWVIYALYS